MKKIFTLLSLVALAVTANAQTEVVNETFSFTGSLAGNATPTGWFKHSGTTTGEITSDGSKASLIAAKTEDVNKSLSTTYSMTTSGQEFKIVYKVKVNVLNSTNLTTTGDYFLSLGTTATTTDGTGGILVLPARLYVKGSATGYTLGVLNNSGGTVTPTYASEVAYGTESNVTVTYIVSTGSTPTNIAKLVVGSQPEVSNSTGTGNMPNQIASIAIRQGGSGTNTTGNITLDDIIVETYAPATLSTIDFNSKKLNLVKNTKVTNEINFGEKANVKIYNVSGSLVKSASVEKNTSLNVSSLPKGVYVVTGEVNGQSISQKIVKE